MHSYSLWGLNPRPMAHKTIALTTELRELLRYTKEQCYLARIGVGHEPYAAVASGWPLASGPLGLWASGPLASGLIARCVVHK